MCRQDSLIPFAKFSERQEANGVSSFSEQVLVLVLASSHSFLHLGFTVVLLEGCPFPGILLCRGNSIGLTWSQKSEWRIQWACENISTVLVSEKLMPTLSHHTGPQYISSHQHGKVPELLPESHRSFQWQSSFAGHFFQGIAFSQGTCLQVFFTSEGVSEPFSRVSVQLSRLNLVPFLVS